MQLELEPDVISGKDVLEVSDLAKSYDGQKLFEHLSFQIQRGDRIALLGDNGTGKTTILKIINGVVEADARKHSAGSECLHRLLRSGTAESFGGEDPF